MSGFSYLRLTVRKIVINRIINRAIILQLILVNATITFQSKQRVSQSCVSKYCFSSDLTINEGMKVKTTQASLSHFLQKHNENCLKNDKTTKNRFEKLFFVFLNCCFLKSASKSSLFWLLKHVHIFFCLKEHIKAQGHDIALFLKRLLSRSINCLYKILARFFTIFDL